MSPLPRTQGPTRPMRRRAWPGRLARWLQKAAMAWRDPWAQGPHLLWLYALAFTPLLTDLVELGSWPQNPRFWLTEAAAGLVIAALVHHVRRQHGAALSLARADPLTGLGNRRSFVEALEDECARARRSLQPLSLVYLDLDNFKQVNDHHGHDHGDRVLQQLADAIRHVVRARVDRGFRLGGDEFVVLLPGSDEAAAAAVVKRIRQRFNRPGGAWQHDPLSVSAGVAQFAPQGSANLLMQQADEAMYRDKSARQRRAGAAGWRH